MANRPPVSRLLVSDATAVKVEGVRIRIASVTNREWTKTAIHDALIAVGLAHLEEVMAQLTGTEGVESEE